MESVTAKISAIFSNDTDDWQHMILEVDRADPTVLRPEVIPLVTTALEGHRDKGETLNLAEFCRLLDHAVSSLALRGPTTHMLARRRRPAALSASGREGEEDVGKESEEREMTFCPKIDTHSEELARALGRDGSKPIEEVLYREIKKQERRRRIALRQREEAFKKECPFIPSPVARWISGGSSGGRGGQSSPSRCPRYANEIAADKAREEG
ncbi:unnamed protein product, partial [Discosporangium mesarthrocarpum]